MLSKYAQEFSEYLSSMMGRSIIITDTNGIIIGAPANERIGDFHPPSIPVMKYKKMSFDDAIAAKKLGVWYPGTTVPLFYNGSVVGTAAIAGEPEVVLQFTMLVKNQIESMLREKIQSHSHELPQKKINELVRDISVFTPGSDDPSALTARASQYGFSLDGARSVIAVYFSNFLRLGLENNPVKISYESNADPIEDEINYTSTSGRVVALLREIFPDPGTIIANTARDKFVVIPPCAFANSPERELEISKKRAGEIYEKLKGVSLETIVGVGIAARNFYELPNAYRNAWDVVSIAKRLSLAPGVYAFNELLLEEMLISVKPNVALRHIEKKLQEAASESDIEDLLATFKTYCECFFNRKEAAQRLHLHRNTLSYRLQKTEERLGVSQRDFKQAAMLYLALHLRDLNGGGQEA